MAHQAVAYPPGGGADLGPLRGLAITVLNQGVVVLEKGGVVMGRIQLADIHGDKARVVFEFGPEIVILREKLWKEQRRGAAAKGGG